MALRYPKLSLSTLLNVLFSIDLLFLPVLNYVWKHVTKQQKAGRSGAMMLRCFGALRALCRKRKPF